MNGETRGGASRPRRRRVLLAGGILMAAGVLVMAIRESSALVSVDLWDEPNREFTQPDTVYARELMAAVAGANGVLCGAVDRTFDTGYWTHSLAGLIESDFQDAHSAELAGWIGKRHFDESVLSIAREAMNSGDACVRRMGARLAGQTKLDRLHERLAGELSSSQAKTRAAALFALGFAEDRSALPAITERLRDSDRGVRVAAIWALGALGDPDTNPALAAILESDGDAVVRSAAAWALGRIND